MAKQTLAVRFVVPESLKTYAFTIRLFESRGSETEFVMEASGFVVLAHKPQHFVFDPIQRKNIRYVGRVPPRRDVNGSLSDLDARVEYVHHAPYR